MTRPRKRKITAFLEKSICPQESTWQGKPANLRNFSPKETGEALVEFILLSATILIPLAYLVLTLADLQAAAFAAEASARDAAYMLSHDLSKTSFATEQIHLNFATYLGENSTSAELHYWCEPGPCRPGSMLHVEVSTAVDLPLLPPQAAGFLQAQIPVSAGYSLPIEGLVIRP